MNSGSTFLTIVLQALLAALGRAFSRTNVGPPPPQYDRFMWLELAFAIAIALTQYFRFKN